MLGSSLYGPSGMKDGDVAGLSAFNSDAGILAVTCKGNQKFFDHEDRKC